MRKEKELAQVAGMAIGFSLFAVIGLFILSERLEKVEKKVRETNSQ